MYMNTLWTLHVLQPSMRPSINHDAQQRSEDNITHIMQHQNK